MNSVIIVLGGTMGIVYEPDGTDPLAEFDFEGPFPELSLYGDKFLLRVGYPWLELVSIDDCVAVLDQIRTDPGLRLLIHQGSTEQVNVFRNPQLSQNAVEAISQIKYDLSPHVNDESFANQAASWTEIATRADDVMTQIAAGVARGVQLGLGEYILCCERYRIEHKLNPRQLDFYLKDLSPLQVGFMQLLEERMKPTSASA